ncbi:branched-chain amino acid ABC transporter substrate-binding protein [Massilia sp. W12]|uniref:branched-chain amino acid ABC transporter substrate-binding protein n=1 Tax=Massilia sp. W12 TaxID=3126507 RepID=UPI0030D2F879
MKTKIHAIVFSLAAALSAQASELPPIPLALIEATSGPFANAGDAVQRNLQWSIEKINAGGGVKLPDGKRLLQLKVFDNKGQVDESLQQLRRALDQKIPFILQGNSSAVALALSDALNKHNARHEQRALFLNYSAVDPALTEEQCSFWHFRFDAHAGMRMHALTEVIRQEKRVQKVYLIGQDYSFGRQVATAARAQLAAKRPDIQIVGEELHPIGKIKDFAPYIAKIRESGADSVITGNWGNDLSLLVKAAREAGLRLRFFTFYGNGLGAPAALGEAGVGQVRAVAEWHPNVGGKESDAFYQAFRQRYPQPKDDYLHLRMQIMLEMLAAAIERAGSVDAKAVALALENASYKNAFHQAGMRKQDHQLLQPLYVSVMQKQADGAIRFDNEGSGYGFKTELYLDSGQTALPSKCQMQRP